MISEILRLGENNYLSFRNIELNEVLKNFSVVYEADTILSDKIRILEKDNFFFIQEITNKQEIIFRRMKDESAARELINQRMEIYEKMWDGCGCKVDYYSKNG
jgi:hypothetical protein